MERFKAGSCSHVIPHNNDGAFVFFREDGTSFAYILNSTSSFYLSDGNTEIVTGSYHLVMCQFRPIYRFSSVTNESHREWREAIEGMNEQGGEINLIRVIKRQETLLHKACASNVRCSVISDILLRVRNLTSQDEFSYTPLHYACRFSAQSSELIKLLVEEEKSALTIKDCFGRYPLHIALDSNPSEEVVKLLLSDDPSTREQIICQPTDTLRLNPLHIALNRSLPENIIKVLLDADESGDSVIECTIAGHYPLHIAILKKLPHTLIQKLLDKESRNHNIIYTTLDGMMPIHLACLVDSSVETISTLLQNDYDGRSLITSVDINSWLYQIASGESMCDSDHDKDSEHDSEAHHHHDTGSITTLHLALEYSSCEIAALILHKWSVLCREGKYNERDLVFKKDTNQRYPLHIACEKNICPNIVQKLLDFDLTNKTVRGEDKFKNMPIHLLCHSENQNPETLKILLNSEDEYYNLHSLYMNDKKSGQALDTEGDDYLLQKSQDYDDENTGHCSMESAGTISSNGSLKMDRLFEIDGHDRISTRWPNHRGCIPLYIALQSNASPEFLAPLLDPKWFCQKNFDNETIEKLSRSINESPELQELVLDIVGTRGYFVVLFLEFYANVGSLVTFLMGSEHLLNNSISLIEPILLSVFLTVFLVREAFQIYSEKMTYLTDVWSMVQLVTAGFICATIVHMIDCVGKEDPPIKRPMLIMTGALLVTQVTFFLRNTFLPFARFVSAFLSIFLTLFPFFIVSGLLLLAFTYVFRMEGGREGCETLADCYYFTLQSFFSGSDSTNNSIDVLFGIVASLILLNVVIAIVDGTWGDTAAEATKMYWNYRVSYLMETRMLAKWQRRLTRAGWLDKICAEIDATEKLAFRDEITWMKEPYIQVKRRDMYKDPHGYFDVTMANIVESCHSLQADMYWSKKEAEDGNKLFAVTYHRSNALFSWLKLLVKYSALVILGCVTGGWFWPTNFRKVVISVGVHNGRELWIEKVMKKENDTSSETEREKLHGNDGEESVNQCGALT
jgi:ankyrin repeat protein